MDQRRETGRQGEALARAYLESRGWTIHETNWRSRLGEIDIVATAPDGPHLVFIEVRTKRSHAYGTAAESVDARKQRQVRRLGLHYAKQRGQLHRPLRFDVIAVYMPSTPAKAEINHIAAAF